MGSHLSPILHSAHLGVDPMQCLLVVIDNRRMLVQRTALRVQSTVECADLRMTQWL
jgi:hypothetical protein